MIINFHTSNYGSDLLMVYLMYSNPIVAEVVKCNWSFSMAVLELLNKNGAKVNKTDRIGWNPLISYLKKLT